MKKRQQVVPLWAIITKKGRNKYGSIHGLPDDELANPDELERQVMREEFGPVLRLPVKRKSGGFRPTIDGDGDVDWGAFGTVDFERKYGPVARPLRKVERLVAKRKDMSIMYEMVTRRLPRTKYRIFEYLRKGLLDLGQIEDFDMYIAGEMHLGLVRINAEIERLRKKER